MSKKRTNQRLEELQAEPETSPLHIPEHVPAGPYKRKADLTPTLISLAHTTHLFVEILSEVERHAMPGIARSEDGTVPVVRIRDLQSNERGTLLCTTVLLSVFERMGTITGQRLEIHSSDPRPGKNYRDVRVWEIE